MLTAWSAFFFYFYIRCGKADCTALNFGGKMLCIYYLTVKAYRERFFTGHLNLFCTAIRNVLFKARVVKMPTFFINSDKAYKCYKRDWLYHANL